MYVYVLDEDVYVYDVYVLAVTLVVVTRAFVVRSTYERKSTSPVACELLHAAVFTFVAFCAHVDVLRASHIHAIILWPTLSRRVESSRVRSGTVSDRMTDQIPAARAAIRTTAEMRKDEANARGPV